MIYFGGKAVEKMIKVVQLNPLNKVAGIVFSAIKMLYILSILLLLLESYDEKGQFFPESTKKESLLYHPVKDLSTKTVPGLANSTIFLGNALKEEQDSTGLTVQQILRAKEVADSLGIDAHDAKTIVEIHEKYGQKN
jgi:membrane protein required for colicin V production